MDLSAAKTREFVAELEKREGVVTKYVEPYVDETASINGPAVIPTVTD